MCGPAIQLIRRQGHQRKMQMNSCNWDYFPPFLVAPKSYQLDNDHILFLTLAIVLAFSEITI